MRVNVQVVFFWVRRESLAIGGKYKWAFNFQKQNPGSVAILSRYGQRNRRLNLAKLRRVARVVLHFASCA